MITIERVSTGIVATPHNEDWQIEQLLPNLVFMGGDVRTIFNNSLRENYTFEFTIEWYLEDVRVRSFRADSDDAVTSFDFNVNFEFDKMVIKAAGHDDVEICFKVVTETGTDIKKIDFFNVEDEETALFWQYTRTSLYRGESLSLDGEQFVTQDGKIIPIEQDPITKYNVVFGGVLGMPVWQAESLNAKFGNADFIKIDGGIFQVETAPALTFLSDNLVNVTIGGYFTTEQYRGEPLLPIFIPPVVKSSYQLWQEGFNANWDSVVANAPMTNTGRILHVYTKVEFLKMSSNFPTDAEIYTYNGSVYRQITMDANNRLAFVEADYMTNTFDNLQYVCVVWGGTNLGTYVYFVNLPVVYSNTKSYRQSALDDIYANLLWQSLQTVPFIRGIDCYKLQNILIHPTLEHLTYQTIANGITIGGIYGTDNNVRLLKNIIDAKTPEVSLVLNDYQNYDVQISDEKLADWFYNYLIYNNSSVPRYRFLSTNNVKMFKFNPNFQLKTLGYYYLNGLPNAIYLTGTVTENQTSTVNDGLHGFNNSNWTMLINFPMWTVLEGATTGCLLPRPYGSTAVATANFIFYSKNLERKYFCEFDENGTIIEDPTKYFLCNLPVQTISGQSVRFVTNTFWSLFTANEITKIEQYIGLKNWGITWQ